MMTHRAREASVRKALEEISAHKAVTAPPNLIRVEEEREGL
jgi:hypothetical protein